MAVVSFLMSRSIQAKLTDRWSQFFLSQESYFVTLTFNWRGRVTAASAVRALRDLSHRLDADRLGGRFYEFGSPDRTLFVLVPEKFDSYAHYHGLVMRPDDARAKNPVQDFPELLAKSWSAVVPGGSFDCQPLRSGGALDYATKETAITSDHVVGSFEFWGSKSVR